MTVPKHLVSSVLLHYVTMNWASVLFLFTLHLWRSLPKSSCWLVCMFQRSMGKVVLLTVHKTRTVPWTMKLNVLCEGVWFLLEGTYVHKMLSHKSWVHFESCKGPSEETNYKRNDLENYSTTQYHIFFVYAVCKMTCALFTVTESGRTPGSRPWSLTPNTTNYYFFFYCLFCMYVYLCTIWLHFGWIMKHYVDYS